MVPQSSGAFPAPSPSAGEPAALTRQNTRTLALLSIGGLLAGAGIGLAFSRSPGADLLVLAGMAIALGGAVSSLLAGRLALREVLDARRVEWRDLLAFVVLGAEAWYVSFLLRL